MKNKKQSWEDKLRCLLQNSEVTKGTRKAIEGLISSELATEYERGRHDNIIDISTWKNLGERKGYFKFFEKGYWTFFEGEKEKLRQQEKDKTFKEVKKRLETYMWDMELGDGNLDMVMENRRRLNEFGLELIKGLK